jgi:hypothetical protein
MQTVPISDVVPPDVPRAVDGFSLSAQPFGVQQQFVQVFGLGAWQEWVNEHNAQIRGSSAAPAATAASTVAPASASTVAPAPASPSGATPAAATSVAPASPAQTPLLAPPGAATATTPATPSLPAVTPAAQ